MSWSKKSWADISANFSGVKAREDGPLHSSHPEHVGPLPKIGHGQKSRLGEKEERRITEERNWRKVCGDVDIRDGMFCRACRRRVIATMRMVANRREHHHWISLGQGGRDILEHLLNLCLACHQAVHLHRTLEITAQTAAGANGLMDFNRQNPETGAWTMYSESTTAYSVTREA